MEGTIINAAGIVAGSLAGAALHSHLPKGIVSTSIQATGLMVLLIGISMALLGTDYVLIIFSLVSGAVIGELLAIEKRLDAFAEGFRKRAHLGQGKFAGKFARPLFAPSKKGPIFPKEKVGIGKSASAFQSNEKLAAGFITASLIYCTGSMAILGAVQDGVGQTLSLIHI